MTVQGRTLKMQVIWMKCSYYPTQTVQDYKLIKHWVCRTNLNETPEWWWKKKNFEHRTVSTFTKQWIFHIMWRDELSRCNAITKEIYWKVLLSENGQVCGHVYNSGTTNNRVAK